MANKCVLFPGQGSQSQGMTLSLYDNFSLVKDLYTEASDALSYDCYQMIKENPDSQLNKTEITQPMLLLASTAVFRVAENEFGFKPDYAAGHSLGEYSALHAAGVLEFADALQLVRTRGELMQQAVPEGEGAMAAIIGADDEVLLNACADSTAGYVTCANYNSPGQVVISGTRAGVEGIVAIAKSDLGAKLAKLLPVSVPSHCDLMKPMAEEFQSRLDAITLSDAAFPIVTNVDNSVHQTANEIKECLIQQLYSPVLWRQSIEALANNHQCQIMIEMGAGKVLSGLNKRISKELQSVSVSEVGDLDALRSIL